MPRPARCSLCYWSGQCREDGWCEDFTPLDLFGYDDAYVDELIENGRIEFRQYWREYNKERDQELFF